MLKTKKVQIIKKLRNLQQESQEPQESQEIKDLQVYSGERRDFAPPSGDVALMASMTLCIEGKKFQLFKSPVMRLGSP